MCVCVCVCLFVVFFHHTHVRTCSPRHGKTFIIVTFAKNAWFRSYGVICLPLKPPTTLKPQTMGYQRNQLKVGKPLIVATLTENASLRSYGTFAYLFRVHIRNINMRRYITSVREHELSGRVRAHAYYYAWAECTWVAK